jgi:hypothetical protein
VQTTEDPQRPGGDNGPFWLIVAVVTTVLVAAAVANVVLAVLSLATVERCG